jgi:hypothetical protein
MDSIVSRTRSGVTSSLIVASPMTWMRSRTPFAFDASSSWRLTLRRPSSKVWRTIDCFTARLLHRVGVGRELIADRRPDEVGSVRVETLANQKVYVAEIDESHIDRDFLAVALSVAQSVDLASHLRHRLTLLLDGMWMVGLGLQVGSVRS